MEKRGVAGPFDEEKYQIRRCVKGGQYVVKRSLEIQHALEAFP